MRVRVPKPQRAFLELDELRALMDAAAAPDPTTGQARPDEKAHGPRRGPFQTANGGKVRETETPPRHHEMGENRCKAR